MKYAEVESMLCQDFEAAKVNHDFSEMSDNYEMLRELWATGELDSEWYHNAITPMIHCFVEIKDSKIELPLMYKSCKQNLGKKVIYSLEEDTIKFVLDNADNERIFEYFEDEGIETKYVILQKNIELNTLAVKTLQLQNADIVELCIDDEIISISKS